MAPIRSSILLYRIDDSSESIEAKQKGQVVLIGDVGEGCVRQPIAETASAFNSTFLSIGDVENAVIQRDRTDGQPATPFKFQRNSFFRKTLLPRCAQ